MRNAETVYHRKKLDASIFSQNSLKYQEIFPFTGPVRPRKALGETGAGFVRRFLGPDQADGAKGQCGGTKPVHGLSMSLKEFLHRHSREEPHQIGGRPGEGKKQPRQQQRPEWV